MEFRKVYDPQFVANCQMFDWDCGKLFNDPSLDGVSLFNFTPTQRTGKVVNFDALTPEELRDKQDRERRARVEQMAEMLTPQKLAELEESDESITDMLEPPIWL